MAIGPVEMNHLMEQLQSIRDSATDDKIKAAELYACPSPDHDARVTTFAKMINVLNSVLLAFTFASKHLLHKSWWDAIARTPIPDSDKQVYVNEFTNFIKIGFVHALFSSVESSLRLFLRALDPEACNGGMAGFKLTYDCLFNLKLAKVPTDGGQLLDLLRLVRNTIHNNGVYFSPGSDTTTLTWKGDTFEFQQGIAVDFVSWEFLIRVADSVRTLLQEVVEDDNLRGITAEINDPFSHY